MFFKSILDIIYIESKERGFLKMKTSRAFTILMNGLNKSLEEMNAQKFYILDEENPDFCISSIYYDSEADKIFFSCERVEEVD